MVAGLPTGSSRERVARRRMSAMSIVAGAFTMMVPKLAAGARGSGAVNWKIRRQVERIKRIGDDQRLGREDGRQERLRDRAGDQASHAREERVREDVEGM